MTKTERLFHLLDILSSNEKIRISKLAAVCKTSERTVYRDLRALANLGYSIDSGNGYSLASHILKPLAGQFNDIELRLIRFALETHQLGAVFPFTDLAARLDIAPAPVSPKINLSAESEFTLAKNESVNRLLDNTRRPAAAGWLSKVVDKKDESKE